MEVTVWVVLAPVPVDVEPVTPVLLLMAGLFAHFGQDFFKGTVLTNRFRRRAKFRGGGMQDDLRITRGG